MIAILIVITLLKYSIGAVSHIRISNSHNALIHTHAFVKCDTDNNSDMIRWMIQSSDNPAFYVPLVIDNDKYELMKPVYAENRLAIYDLVSTDTRYYLCESVTTSARSVPSLVTVVSTDYALNVSYARVALGSNITLWTVDKYRYNEVEIIFCSTMTKKCCVMVTKGITKIIDCNTDNYALRVPTYSYVIRNVSILNEGAYYLKYKNGYDILYASVYITISHGILDILLSNWTWIYVAIIVISILVISGMIVLHRDLLCKCR